MSGKLKGIYDALDHGQYKNACKLCSGFLQKSPSHALVRALHAVALERCGRRDEAIRLCQDTVTAGIASEKNSLAAMDDTCLSTLQVVLRRCRQWPLVAQMYEAAWNKEPEMEEYGVVLFLTAVHSNDFTKAQQVATKLYQKYKKPQCLQWVIASILLQVRAGASPKALDLAQMMLQKAPVDVAAFSKGKVPFNRGQVYLFFLHLGALQLQQKQAEALKLLEDCKPLLKLPSDVSALRVHLLWEAGRQKEAVKEAREQLVASPGSWAQAQDLARMVSQLPGEASCTQFEVPTVTTLEDVETHRTEDEVRNALLLFRYWQQVQEHSTATGGGSGVNRVAVLGELELRRCALAKSSEQKQEDVEELLKVLLGFIQRFSGRAHCFFDLKPHLCYLSAADALPLLTGAGQGREAVVLTARLRRAFRRHDGAAGAECAAEVLEARRLVESWQDLGGFEGGPDALLQLAVVALLEADRAADPAKAPGRQHLLDAIGLAQMALAQQPHVFGFKVLLMLLYNALDLPVLMMKLYSTMDIKNIQHESLSYLVLDSLRDPEKLQQVSRSIQAFHEDLDKDGQDALNAAFQMQGAVHCRAPEYVDGLLKVSHSMMWGRAIVEETVSELSGSSWETLECRQLRVLQLVAEVPSEKWAWRNQDRALLNGLQPLPQRRCGGTTEQAFGSSKSLTSFAASWGQPSDAANLRDVGDRDEDLEPGHGAAELLLGVSTSFPTAGAQLTLSAALLRCAGMLVTSGVTEDFSSCLSLARPALALLHGEEKTLAEAAAEATASAAGSCWGKAQEAFRTFGNLCSFSACDSALLLHNATPEAWEKLCRHLEAISSSLGTILPCLRLNFHPPPRAGEAPAEGDGLGGPYGLGSYGARSLGTLNQMFLVLSVVLLWLGTALPKSSKKAKADDVIHQSRLALRDTLQFVQRCLNELQADLQSAAKLESAISNEAVQAACIFRDVLKGSVLEQLQSLEVLPGLLEAHRTQLKSLAELMGQRLALLKSKAFKP